MCSAIHHRRSNANSDGWISREKKHIQLSGARLLTEGVCVCVCVCVSIKLICNVVEKCPLGVGRHMQSDTGYIGHKLTVSWRGWWLYRHEQK